MRAAVPALAALGLVGCMAEPRGERIPAAAPPRAAPAVAPATIPIPGPPLAPAELAGRFEQGGWVRGIAPFGAVRATLDGRPLALDAERRFFAGFDRDAETEAVLVFTASDRQTRTHRLSLAPRAWDIERVNTSLRPAGSSAAFRERRAGELARIAAARTRGSDAAGWRQDFVWPAPGRISGRFGAQRIYQGQPGSYHSGLDIAGGAGTIYVAPADGVVVLAAPDFSLEGNLLIVDHGQGLNSAFLHSSALLVEEGERVRQGQPLGRIGATGRATGPHLHWSIKWQDARLDPLLFLPPRS